MVDQGHHDLAVPEPGKARVYVVPDLGGLHSPLGKGNWVTKAALDGSWVGGNKNVSFFSLSVDPGTHYLCIATQSHYGEVIEMQEFTAASGETYFFRIRNLLWLTPMLMLDRINSDQGKYMVSTAGSSSFQFGK